MKKKCWRILAISCMTFLSGWVWWHISLSQAHAQAQILQPPYYGETSINAVFDHEFPRYARESDDEYLICANDAAVITTTVFHYNGTHSTALYYSGHDGIDFGLNYRYVLAAHSGEVSEAGWANAQNRRAGLGLRITLLADDEIHRTEYGHMSSLLLQSGDTVTQRDVIGISGNTGNSTDPHLHFTVRAKGIVVNPYGWAGGVQDPWQCVNSNTANQSLWEILPNISNAIAVYPDGPGLIPPSNPTPPLTPDWTNPVNLLIDNSGTPVRFNTYGYGWNMATCNDTEGECIGGTYWWRSFTYLTGGYANWSLLVHDTVVGQYDVYAYIPYRHADTVLAHYKIYHNDQIHSAGIDQSQFNKEWAYLGRYNFADGTAVSQPQKIQVFHEGDSAQDMAADAIMLVLADGPPDLTLNIAQGSDDAGTHPVACGFDLAAAEVYTGHCANGGQIISGFRYNGVNIPADATITRAHLLFTVDQPYTQTMHLRFYGDNSPASPTFSSSNKPQDRPLTSAWLQWEIPTADEWYIWQKRYSPNLAPVAQEIVTEHPNWQPGVSALTFIVQPVPGFTGNQHRRVMAYEREGLLGYYSARLLLWYESP